jgi:long-chain acyl-CoA synthetase
VAGELWVKGPRVVKLFWNKPEAMAETFVDGCLRTGDLARIDEEGFLIIIDRAKGMLIRGGENIYCVEIENVLYDDLDVMDAALVGVPHKTLGEEPAACKALVKVDLRPATLARDATGAILGAGLKQVFEGG